jgi:hypothetical protein
MRVFKGLAPRQLARLELEGKAKRLLERAA